MSWLLAISHLRICRLTCSSRLWGCSTEMIHCDKIFFFFFSLERTLTFLIAFWVQGNQYQYCDTDSPTCKWEVKKTQISGGWEGEGRWGSFSFSLEILALLFAVELEHGQDQIYSQDPQILTHVSVGLPPDPMTISYALLVCTVVLCTIVMAW